MTVITFYVQNTLQFAGTQASSCLRKSFTPFAILFLQQGSPDQLQCIFQLRTVLRFGCRLC